jgi:branched-chain amino acid transport system ATP-binding protein
MSILKVDDLRVSFQGNVILNGLSFAIEKGQTVGIIGPNGSGKTTLFNCISGFVSVSGGRISYKDNEIQNLMPNERASLGIGRVFQNFGIFREMSLVENILLALEGTNRKEKADGGLDELRARSIEFLKEVKLEQKADSKAGSLSGGQMRLLEIIRTLAFGADLFLLDEPTAGVSPKMKDDVAGLIKKLQGIGKTVLIIEHDINFIQKFCNRIIVLNEGRVVLDDTPELVRKNEQLKEIYFGGEA